MGEQVLKTSSFVVAGSFHLGQAIAKNDELLPVASPSLAVSQDAQFAAIGFGRTVYRLTLDTLEASAGRMRLLAETVAIDPPFFFFFSAAVG
jgi:hypothetical protein